MALVPRVRRVRLLRWILLLRKLILWMLLSHVLLRRVRLLGVLLRLLGRKRLVVPALIVRGRAPLGTGAALLLLLLRQVLGVLLLRVGPRGVRRGSGVGLLKLLVMLGRGIGMRDVLLRLRLRRVVRIPSYCGGLLQILPTKFPLRPCLLLVRMLRRVQGRELRQRRRVVGLATPRRRRARAAPRGRGRVRVLAKGRPRVPRARPAAVVVLPRPPLVAPVVGIAHGYASSSRSILPLRNIYQRSQILKRIARKKK